MARLPFGFVRRVIGAIGRAFVTIGLLILLFVAYQLWGTGIFESRAQRDLRGDFESKLASETQTSSTEAQSETTTTTTPPSTTTAPHVSPPPDGEAVAIIKIPAIGVDKVVVEGTTVADLRKGPGHYTGTPLPGEIGNAAIAGHRTTYGAPFGNLDQLHHGDRITVITLTGTWDYEVVDHGVFAVKPTDVEVLQPDDPSAATLTLTSCNPKYSARERLVVKAELEPRANQQALPPSVPIDEEIDLDAGLSGAHTSRGATLLWGAIAALFGGFWWLIFHRYGRWTTWIAGALPFAVTLFVFYAYLERVLPSNY